MIVIRLDITDGLTSPTLSLSTLLTREHFTSGVLRLSCQAVIYSVWDESSLALYPSIGTDILQSALQMLILTNIFPEVGEKALERILRGGSKMLRPGLLLVIVSLVSVLI